MRINFSFFLYLFLSFLLIIAQTSVVPTTSLGKFTPDLNLIIIICLAVRTEIPYPFTLATLNGFLMDIFSAGTWGLHTITRFAVFLLLRVGLHNINYDRNHPFLLSLAFFTGTLLMHLLFLVLLLFKQDSGQAAFLSLELALYQAIINTVVGVPMIMLLRKLDGITKA
ncbi:MAG: rod shape-determining protein MreD [Candidatus Dadabacteria bacterium]|nr:rod shape-determining protein MreD [Candidatus Dadabacteria bacterium]MYA49040.1 rod shape-determining protein MreD [Candidatus Dadabacteria bacterium]MYF47607.1 rod shape-determining protein MreD [Candidatus Dadabacteria bacterium]MYK49485.1 rod shape-determining protein MreD [Candidatus Dadabacteria bacterium]